MIATHHAAKVVPAATPSTGLLPEDAQTRRFEAGETVFFDDDAADEVFEVEVGVVRLCKLLPDGRRAGLGFRFAGETFGIGAGREYSCTAETVTPVTLRGTRRRMLEDAAERSPELLGQALWRRVAGGDHH